MPDDFDPPAGDDHPDLSPEAVAQAEASPAAEVGPFSWDQDPPPDDPDAPRERHDAFTEARKSVYLRALVKTGCITDACRLTGVSPRTIYRHQESDPAFFENCRVALQMSGTPAEITAWQRAVEGVEQEFACGGQVHVRRRYSDGLLRLLLQGSNPRKYGPRPGFKRKRILKHERKQMEREIRAELADSYRPRSLDEVRDSILRKLEAIERHNEPEKLAAGWTRSEDGHWVPPGYGWIGLPECAAAAGDAVAGIETPRDSI